MFKLMLKDPSSLNCLADEKALKVAKGKKLDKRPLHKKRSSRTLGSINRNIQHMEGSDYSSLLSVH